METDEDDDAFHEHSTRVSLPSQKHLPISPDMVEEDIQVRLLTDAGYSSDLAELPPLMTPPDNSPPKRNQFLPSCECDFSVNSEISSFDDADESIPLKEEVDFTHLVSVVENDIKDISSRISTPLVDFYLSCKNEEDADVQICNHFDSIPNEIILKIFSYFSPVPITKFIASVCKRWHKLAYDKSLWATLNFDFNRNVSSINLCWIIKRVGCIRKLVIQGRPDLNEAEVSVFTEFCPLLMDVDLGFCTTCTASILEYFAKNCESLESVNVEGCPLVGDDCCKVLAKCKKLKHLNFSHCIVTDVGLIHLANNLQQVVSLNIDGISWMNDESILALVELHRDHLQGLDIDGAELSDRSIEAVASCPRLERLAISFCELMTDASLCHIANLKRLRCLTLKKANQMYNAAFLELFSKDSMASLTSLNLSDCCDILDSTIIQMTKCCGRNLRQLYLSWCCDLRENAMVAIVDTCSLLETLELVGLHNISGKCFERIPERMPNLTNLDLRQCNMINDNVIREMLRRKPDLQVIDYYGEDFRCPWSEASLE